MTNILRAACLAGTIFSLSIVPGEAQSQSKEVKKEPVQATSPNSGSEMFVPTVHLAMGPTAKETDLRLAR